MFCLAYYIALGLYGTTVIFQLNYCVVNILVWRCFPNQLSGYNAPSPKSSLHLRLSDWLTKGIQFVYRAYIRHGFSYLAVVVMQTDFLRRQLFGSIYCRICQRATVIPRYILPVRQPSLAHHHHCIISWVSLFS